MGRANSEDLGACLNRVVVMNREQHTAVYQGNMEVGTLCLGILWSMAVLRGMAIT